MVTEELLTRMPMWWWTTVVICLIGPIYPSLGYRDGARENSCYNHTIDHGPKLVLLDCVPPSCRYHLIIKEVFAENLTDMSVNDTTSIMCGDHLYSIEVANTLNPPEGFLVQARSGPEDSSRIIGTFLDPSVVTARNTSIPVNYKILKCRSHQNAEPLLHENSATHPNTVNSATKILLYWKPPVCGEYRQSNIYFWFTIVQQFLIGYSPTKTSNILSYSDLFDVNATNVTDSATTTISTSVTPPTMAGIDSTTTTFTISDTPPTATDSVTTTFTSDTHPPMTDTTTTTFTTYDTPPIVTDSTTTAFRSDTPPTDTTQFTPLPSTPPSSSSPPNSSIESGIPFCDCERHVECTVEGRLLRGSNVRLVSGTQMKCSVKLERVLATMIKARANVDLTFDQTFLSPGSLLFLKHLGVIIDSPEETQFCNISSYMEHSYQMQSRKFDSWYVSTEELQELAINSDYLTGILGPDNACSFLSLAYYLTTSSQYLRESAMCRVSGSEDTIVNFTAYCG